MQPQSTVIDTNSQHLKRKRSPSKERQLDSSLGEGNSLSLDVDRSFRGKKPRLLRINIPSALNSGLETTSDPGDTHSLFSGSDNDSLLEDINEHIEITIPTTSLEEPAITDSDNVLALRTGPPIPGLFFDPSILLPQELADEVVSYCMKTYFLSPLDNQVMLFGRLLPSTDPASKSSTGFPPILLDLLEKISHVIRPVIPPAAYDILFPAHPTRARQAIINLYQPGEGITPHVDLLGRYGDGIIGVSFSSSTAMRFDKVDSGGNEIQNRWDLYLPERTIIVLSEEARYKWTHGIDRKKRDFVSSGDHEINSNGSWINRGTRMSVTFRWLLPGADVVGDGL